MRASRIAVLQKTRAFRQGAALLQKQAARVILYANRQVSSVPLFNKLSWILFNEQSRMDKCSIIYNHVNGTLTIYLNDHIIINNNRHARILAMPI